MRRNVTETPSAVLWRSWSTDCHLDSAVTCKVIASVRGGIDIPEQPPNGGKTEMASSAGTDHGGVQAPSGLQNLEIMPS